MRSLGLAIVATILAVAGCGSGTPTPEPAESVPPVPVASPGWASVGSMGGSGSGWHGGEYALAGRPTVLDAVCVGNGTLVVAVSASGRPLAGFSRAFVVECGGASQQAATRVTLADLIPIPDRLTVSGAIVDSPGVLRHAAFQVSVEQPSS